MTCAEIKGTIIYDQAKHIWQHMEPFQLVVYHAHGICCPGSVDMSSKVWITCVLNSFRVFDGNK